jgi:hypothetical protein
MVRGGGKELFYNNPKIIEFPPPFPREKGESLNLIVF